MEEKNLIKIVGILARDASVLMIGNRAYVKVLVDIETPQIPKVKKQIAFSFLSGPLVIVNSIVQNDMNRKRLDAFMLSKKGDRVWLSVRKNQYGIPEAEIQRFKNITLDLGDTYVSAI